MKIRHNIVTYVIPLFFVVCLLVGGVAEPSESGTAMIVTGFVILAAVAIHWLTTSLEVKDGLIAGRTGLIKKQRLSSALSKIQYCEYTHFLCFNKIRINAITGQYTFKNMSHADKFADMVNKGSM